MNDNDNLRPRYHFRHRWTKWQEKSFTVSHKSFVRDWENEHTYLVRQCVRCGYVKVRKILVL